MVKIVSGVALILAGSVWILQGLNVAFAPESFMTGEGSWSWVGAGAVAGGIGLIWWGLRSKRRSE